MCLPLLSQVNLPSGAKTVRFTGVCGSSYTGDMAIDSVVMSKAGAGPARPLACPAMALALSMLSRRAATAA